MYIIYYNICVGIVPCILKVLGTCWSMVELLWSWHLQAAIAEEKIRRAGSRADKQGDPTSYGYCNNCGLEIMVNNG